MMKRDRRTGDFRTNSLSGVQASHTLDITPPLFFRVFIQWTMKSNLQAKDKLKNNEMESRLLQSTTNLVSNLHGYFVLSPKHQRVTTTVFGTHKALYAALLWFKKDIISL